MSDVRTALYGVIYEGTTDGVDARWRLADAILERFDVTPKPVVSDVTLGRMVVYAHMGAWPSASDKTELRGARMRDALSSHDLTIVRGEDAK